MCPTQHVRLALMIVSFSSDLFKHRSSKTVMTTATTYMVNARVQGKVHRVTPATAHLPQQRRRVVCGWLPKRSTSYVYYTRAFSWRTYCRKCFPDNLPSLPRAFADAEEIEESGEEDS